MVCLSVILLCYRIHAYDFVIKYCVVKRDVICAWPCITHRVEDNEVTHNTDMVARYPQVAKMKTKHITEEQQQIYSSF